MKKETIEHIIRAVPSFRLNVRTINAISKRTTIISTALCFIFAVFMVISLNKVAEEEYKAIKRMKTTFIDREVFVHDTVSDCDTVFIIDGKRFKQIGE